MKTNKRFLTLSLLCAFMCILPSIFGGEAGEAPETVPSFVKFVTTIFGQDPGAPADFFVFLGRFHPLALHLPIGMLVVAFFMQAFALWKKRDDLHFPYCFVLGCSFVFSMVAVLFGSFLAMQNDYNPDLINRHGWGGLLFSALVGIAFFFKLSFLKSGQEKVVHKKISLVVMFIALNVMSFVGHDGGSLTHGEEYLFDYAPNWVRAITGRDPKVDPNAPIDPELSVYEGLVAPFMKNNCYECHSNAKMKGKLRLDTVEFIQKGGKNEGLIVHGKAADSLLYQLMVTNDEDEIMPPEGILPQDDLDFVKWWIDGSKNDKDLFEKKIKDANVPQRFMDINKRAKSAKPAHAKEAAAVEEVKQQVEEAKEVAETAVAAAEEMIKPAGAVDFMKDIAPIFESRCVKCHGEKKQKGEYRLDKAEFAFTAGDSEEAPIVKGDAAKSYLVTLIKMTDDDDDVMPPKGGVLTADQIAKIEAWIKAGADFPADAALADKSKK
ncbi:MAG: c-type cytochrome [Lentisphaeraceae bacterium]|nr:c-type cytochrome [Lentisphaeraceae bacterium]